MNKARRKRLAEAAELLEQALTIISEAKDEEQDAFDNLPESIQQGERGQTMEEAINSLDDIHTAVEEARDTLAGIAGGA
ncbi:hypothetical protein [Azospirillum argentinense]|uniref:Uncharacterized protein n=1 Tax=Azospirillum brasilense TaxID=192 RepID=A0A4D8QK62_AZOBR|nr:hypothetical protein [Azospirillum argentinense]QCO07299.1 hypothetical protein D3867_36065 [Azospirillum argentinense]